MTYAFTLGIPIWAVVWFLVVFTALVGAFILSLFFEVRA